MQSRANTRPRRACVTCRLCDAAVFAGVTEPIVQPANFFGFGVDAPGAQYFDKLTCAVALGGGFVVANPLTAQVPVLRCHRPDSRSRPHVAFDADAPRLRAYAGSEAVLIFALRRIVFRPIAGAAPLFVDATCSVLRGGADVCSIGPVGGGED